MEHIFRLLTFIYVGVILWMLNDFGDGSPAKLTDGKHTALVQLNGVIGPKAEASAENINLALQSAFEAKGAQGVVLLINSPGGSPVQAGLINDEIRRLRAKHPNTPIYAVVEDLCASGGYYVAAAADKIFVDKASILGSIGVLMEGFGFTGTMEKLGSSVACSQPERTRASWIHFPRRSPSTSSTPEPCWPTCTSNSSMSCVRVAETGSRRPPILSRD